LIKILFITAMALFLQYTLGVLHHTHAEYFTLYNFAIFITARNRD